MTHPIVLTDDPDAGSHQLVLLSPLPLSSPRASCDLLRVRKEVSINVSDTEVNHAHTRQTRGQEGEGTSTQGEVNVLHLTLCNVALFLTSLFTMSTLTKKKDIVMYVIV